MAPRLVVVLLLLTAVAAFLRTWNLPTQIVIDDEWHAIHKLLGATYAQVFASFGHADHSIPLTLFYKAIVDTIGLDEVNFRLPQVLAGIVTVPVAGLLAWRATQRASVAIWTATFVAGAPFLVFYSRFARPYAITVLLTVVALALIWRWRTRPTLAVAAGVVACVAFAAWLHPLVSLFPAAALLFVLAEDLARMRCEGRGPLVRTIALGAAVSVAMAALLAAPLISDFASLSAKAGSTHVPDAYTLWRMISIFLGGLPDAVTAIGLVLALVGAALLVREQRALGLYLIAVVVVPILVVLVARGAWTIFGHTFGRYVIPAQVIVLFWTAIGLDFALRGLGRLRELPGSMAMVAAVAVTYLAAVPTFPLVLRNPQWFGHMVYHLDYRFEHNVLANQLKPLALPGFYSDFPGDEPVVEAPFTFMAPTNWFAWFAPQHRHPTAQGFVHNLCLTGSMYGEVPLDARFHFRSFVDLADATAVRATGARYLVFFTDYRWGQPFKEAPKCIDALRTLYGEPIRRYPTHVVFQLRSP
ncbi:glycosyltransferase family 39 protein [Usitatibacter palustris]|uniref:Uncharacterized protein n=1 Tax=Usitatibacter palustris TaxID=2732487 RepID=A0A6M4H7C4_9PROT|nr:glycosyltransferase family 39 protein [Usitatibacter palustris]QJR15539.1 hypothetical protein DSM104440_02360 [Usitatibacter palustris]